MISQTKDYTIHYSEKMNTSSSLSDGLSTNTSVNVTNIRDMSCESNVVNSAAVDQRSNDVLTDLQIEDMDLEESESASESAIDLSNCKSVPESPKIESNIEDKSKLDSEIMSDDSTSDSDTESAESEELELSKHSVSQIDDKNVDQNEDQLKNDLSKENKIIVF